MESGDPATAAGLLLLDLVEQQQARNADQMPICIISMNMLPIHTFAFTLFTSNLRTELTQMTKTGRRFRYRYFGILLSVARLILLPHKSHSAHFRRTSSREK